ncbi:MAG TPA: adenine deaminase C-terminal domain-containing protein [Candidatus Binatia bacterium]|nr:adenine deaminase C-terminal domain-containing protein [Candidatus Binatia bacterium]
MAHSKEALRRLIRGALGEIKADLIISGGRLVNVYSGEILDGMEIAVLDGRICYVGPNAGHAKGAETDVVDATGLFVAPGFIDGHTHIGHYARPFENLQSFLPHGTTSVVASCDELASVYGPRGLTLFLDEVAQHPVRVYTLVSMVAPQDPLLCSTASFSDSEIAEALADSRVLGMGEIVSWLRLLRCDEELLRRISLARRQRQIIHGHTAGARDQKLCAVAAAGISSCHEPIRFEDALERLRLGYWTMLREGSLRQDLEAILPGLIAAGVSLHRLILVTDSMSPDDVAERGHMDHVVRRAISLGLAPMQAIQAATLNPATYSGLEQDVGGIAPGRFADVVLLEDLETCRVREVWIGGKFLACNGACKNQRAPMDLSGETMRSLSVGMEVTPETFKIASPTATLKVRVIEMVNQTITGERIVESNVRRGLIEADPGRDLLKVAMFDRHSASPKVALGFLKGLGAKVGAVGLTVNLDENSLLVVGSSDHDMALCANALLEAGGGIAVVNGGMVLEKLDLPFGGIFSLRPWQEVGQGLRRIQRRLKEMGSPFDKPIVPLVFLPFVTLPALRITARGLIHVKERKVVPLFAEGA